MSSHNVVLDSSNTTFPAVPVSSTSSGNAVNTITTSSNPVGSVGGSKRFAAYGGNVYVGDFGEAYTFKGHTQASTFASLFGACYLERITFTLVSLVALTPGSSPWIFRFGVIPRGTADSISNKSTAGDIPYLQNFVVGATHHSQAVVTYARDPAPGELSFPPGLQLDLNATEVRFRYPTPAVLHVTQQTVADKKENVALVKWHVEFTLRGEGATFGVTLS
jgi:hypothetical protein